MERLGAGGMGEVFLCRDGDGRVLAVKVLRPEYAGRADVRARLRREAETMRRVESPYIAELVAADGDGETVYLATRYVQGGTLGAYVDDRGPLGGEPLRALAHGLAEALVVIHAAGCVHRDLKPENVILAEGRPVVIDFGIAHALDAGRFTTTGRATGTPAYMSPELLTDGSVGTAADVFAWGATVAFAATGRRAYWSHLSPDALGKLLDEAEQMPREMRGAVDAALSPDPQGRPSARKLVTLLDRPIGDRPSTPTQTPTPVPRPTASPPGRRPSVRRGRRRALWLAAAALAVVIVPRVLGPDVEKEPFFGPDAAPTAAETQTAAETPTAKSAVLEGLPREACDHVPEAMFLGYVADGTRVSHGGPRAGSCAYSSSAGTPFLRLEARIASAVGDVDPVATAKWSYGQDLQMDSEDKGTLTLRMEDRQGIGDAAYVRVYVEAGEAKATTARVVSRIGNVILTVSYSLSYVREAEDEAQACVDGAEAVLREALKVYV
ncbi:hypothetical protein GCM10022221_55960 [Actinocorallia aurea]